MIGGLFKSSSRVAMIAAAGLLSGGVAAQAADLGGNCCADLEERVAELEATTARKGNTKVSLTVSGSVAHSILWHDSNAPGAIRSDRLTANDTFGVNQSAFRFTGSATINADWSAGFKMQIDVPIGGVGVDDTYVYIKSKTYGTIQMGRLESAMDGINGISLGARPDIALDDENNTTAVLGGSGGFYQHGDFDGNDDEGVGFKYISPTVAGFSLSASWISNTNDAGTELSDIAGVALRYAGEFGAIRVAAGIGYEYETDGDATSLTRLATATPSAAAPLEFAAYDEEQTLAGSISVMHVPSGIFANFAAGWRDRSFDSLVTGSQEDVGYHGLIGIETKLTSLGKTTFSAHVNWYERTDNLSGPGVGPRGGNPLANFDSVVWGLGAVQAIDAAAMSMYLSYQNHECVTQVAGSTCTDDANIVSMGVGITF